MNYRIKRELHIRRDIGIYATFGILVCQKRRIVLHVPDVFFRRRQAEAFIRLCNREQPAFIHLFDIIEDAI